MKVKLPKEHSAAMAIAACDDPKLLLELVGAFVMDDTVVGQRASWVITQVAERAPALVAPYLDKMLQRITDSKVSAAAKRNVIRSLQFVNIPEELHGLAMQICFDRLADPTETVAVRVCSMSVLANLARIYPDITRELKLVIEEGLAFEAASGFRARARMVLADDIFKRL